MLRWIREHRLWPPGDVRPTWQRRTEDLLEAYAELKVRVNALEMDLAKLRGRVTGALRVGEDEQLEEEEESPALELDDTRSLGAARRFGKEGSA